MKSDSRILIAPDPVLEAVADPIALGDGEVDDAVAQDLRASVLGSARALAGYLIEVCNCVVGLGIAAPQVGAPVRMIVLNRLKDAFGPSFARDPLVMLNPTWKPLHEVRKDEIEQCFSTPTVRVSMTRYVAIQADWTGLDGVPQTGTFTDLEARVVQHECDHLDGKCLWTVLTPEQRTTYLKATRSARERVNPSGRHRSYR